MRPYDGSEETKRYLMFVRFCREGGKVATTNTTAAASPSTTYYTCPHIHTVRRAHAYACLSVLQPHKKGGWCALTSTSQPNAKHGRNGQHE